MKCFIVGKRPKELEQRTSVYFIILYKTLNLHSRVRSDGSDR